MARKSCGFIPGSTRASRVAFGASPNDFRATGSKFVSARRRDPHAGRVRSPEALLRLRAKPGGHQIFGAARHDQFLGCGTKRWEGE